MISLIKAECHTFSSKKQFGLCDNTHPAKDPAYIDEVHGEKWIATVLNEQQIPVIFTAIDHCIEARRPDGTMDNRCDGALFYNATVIFVELKERDAVGNEWVRDAEVQLRASIRHFEQNVDSDDFITKKAYIANNKHPKFKESQFRRMMQFEKDTGYVLRIENRISIF